MNNRPRDPIIASKSPQGSPKNTSAGRVMTVGGKASAVAKGGLGADTGLTVCNKA